MKNDALASSVVLNTAERKIIANEKELKPGRNEDCWKHGGKFNVIFRANDEVYDVILM